MPRASTPVVEQETKRLGNASKRLENRTVGPWVRWKTRSRTARAIRFMQTYLRPPKGFGAGKPMQLAKFQTDALEAALEDGDVNALVMSLPRGNGKSTFLGGVGTWAVFDPDESGAPQVPIVATTVTQAGRTVYGPALAMIQAEDELRSRSLAFTAIGATKLQVPFTGGEMFPISNDPDGLQGLDPTIAICDEMGFMPMESWDSLLLASGKRPRSLVVGIGTPGFDHDSALWAIRKRFREGSVIPGFRFIEFAADEDCDRRDETQWRKANPAIAAGFKSLTPMRTSVETSPEAHFRIFQLGQWVEGTDSWLGSDGGPLWGALVDTEYRLVEKAPTYVGVDVGLARDSTAVVAVQRRPDDRLHAVARFWVPSKAEPVDVTDVMQHLRELDERYELVEVSFDPRFFDVPAKMLLDEGLPMVEVPQSLERMTPAVGSTYEAIKRREITHEGDDLFSSQVLNAIPRYNERGFTLSKGKSRGRIDGAIALCLAVDRVLRSEGAEEYEEFMW